MVLTPGYEIKIPDDSVVSLQTAGLLGETFVNIETVNASGPPIGKHAVLKSATATQTPSEQFLDKVGEILKQAKSGCGEQGEGSAGAETAAGKHSPVNPKR